MEGSAVLLLATVLHLFVLGSGQDLGVRFPGMTEFFQDPTDIVVGMASDLEVQVECANTTLPSNSGTYVWMYRNGTEIPDGLKPFGITQGMGGVLRVYPASDLTEKNEFVCSDSQGSSLNVTFNLVDSIFFTSPVPLVTDGTVNVTDLCPVPDIPEATVTSMTNDNGSYCFVETRRGNFRSVNIVTNGTEESPSRNVTLFTGPSEIRRRDGQSIIDLLSCDEDDLYLNGTLITRRMIQDYNRSDAGIYQCLSSPEETSTAIVYVIMAYLDTPIISPANISVTLGVNTSNITLSCTMNANPLPVMTWTSASLSSSLLLQPTQAVTGFMEPATSTVTLDVTSVPLGDHAIECSGEDILPDFTVGPVSAQVNVSVNVIFQNIFICTSPDAVDLNTTDSVTVTCNVTSSLEPSFNFSRNGDMDGITVAGLSAGNNLYTSERNFTTSGFNVGMETFSCSSFLDVSNGPSPLTADINVNVSVLFENISIVSSSDNVTLGTGPDTVNVSCSVRAGVMPSFVFYLDGNRLPNSSAPTSNGDEYLSTLVLTMSDLSMLGTRNVTCRASLAGTSVSADFNISVNADFGNLVLTDNVGGEQFILTDSLSGNLTLTCSVQSSLEPTFEWTRNGLTVDGNPVMLISTGYASTLVIDEVDLLPPLEEFQCTASLNVSGVIMSANVSRNVSVEVNFANISVAPTDLMVNLMVSQNGREGVVNLTCSLTASLLPVITWSRDDDTMASRRAAAFVGEGQVESQLVVDAAEFRGEMTFTCMASLQMRQFNGSLNATATITTSVFPAVVEHPDNLTAVAGDNVSLSCSAEGFPAPVISWQDGDGIIVDPNTTFTFTISQSSSSISSSLNNITTSTLSFTANSSSRTTNESKFLCTAANTLPLNDTSTPGQLLLAGPPLTPAPLNVSEITFSNATFSWSEPFSLINVTQYILILTQLGSDSDMTFMSDVPSPFGADVLSFVSASFLPFSNYSASLRAENRAGRSEPAGVEFMTSESVPGPPINITSAAIEVKSVLVAWVATPLGQRNGILTTYTIQYKKKMETAVTNITVDASTTSYPISGLEAGIRYVIMIAASTGAGMGPFSASVDQSTIAVPPNISAAGFVVDMDRVDSTSIAVTLPMIGNSADTFSHYWVIAMIVGEIFDSSENPKTRFTDNSTFVSYSEVLPVNQPYIVAEISSGNYDMARTYMLGNNASNVYNEIPKYVNGPLSSDTRYTVFVWGFSPVPQSGRARRQAAMAPVLQYMSFSSSPFLEPVSTRAISTPLSGGEIAAIVIVIVVVLLLAAAIGVVVCIICERWRYSAEIGPPPSRKGSMRLRDANEVNKDTLRSGSFRVTRGGTLRTSFRAAAGLTLRNPKIEAELADLNPDDARLPVEVDEFAGYVKAMHKNTDHLFSEEYEIITIKSPSLPHVQCSLPANVSKNRYANINCYDNSRVALQGDLNVIGSDYINANYIDGYKRKCAYVAAQGPLANTTHDFWRMVWEQESCCIIMLTNLVEKTRNKCHQYWPEVGSMNLGDLTITLIEVQDLAYYTIRTFRVSRGNDTREIKQFHYTGWPDFGVPDYPSPVIAFIKRVKHYKRTTEGPDVIHCSAGVGRTGTLVTIQCMMQMLEDGGEIDIFNFVLNMRHQRNYMVQTERQYIFIHDTLLEHLRAGNTEVSIQDLRKHYKQLQDQDPNLECSRMEKEYGNLAGLQSIDTTQYHPAQLSVNISKNRYPEIIPYDRYRVRLLLHPGVLGSDYINASYLDGYHRRHQYVVTQGPMSNTVTDFWRMVWEHRCSCIMMLCPLEEKGKEQSVCYWPTDKVRQHGDMFIEQVNISKFPAYAMREIAITNTKINESRTIKHYHYDGWMESQAPSSATDIIDLIGVLQKTQNMCGGGPIIVHDNTGVGRGGAFVVLSSVLEQLKVEGIIDPFFTIHSLRQQQPGLVTNFEQYRFCYQAVMEFLDSFDHYANFD